MGKWQMLSQVHPTISPGTGDILRLIKAGKVQPRPGIRDIDGSTVHFVDGTSQDIDVIICATGTPGSRDPLKLPIM